ncbi:MAG: FAD/NAD(P)-binding protein [Deltaproteobacteria bacterium]|nr:FAD/NAD(P)-binding protein [Deltaproteobacteria bacterium]
MCKSADIKRYPMPATVEKIVTATETEKVFTIRLDGGKTLGHKPGQFVMYSIYGLGEAPISISSSPLDKDTFDLCIRAAGNLTNAIHAMKEGARIGIRGPFGNGFSMDALYNKDVLIAAGGLGLAPLRSLIETITRERDRFGRVILLAGAKRPDLLLYNERFGDWASHGIELHSTVDIATGNWHGHVGVITTLFKYITIDPVKTMAVVVGAPVMFKFVIHELTTRGVFESNILMSLERRMRCGLGKCGHCQINGIYLCQDGPVISYLDAKKLDEAI